MAIIINLWGQPSAGKSSGAAYIFSKLKMAGINAELVTEFAKDKVWENNEEALNNQAYMFGNQYFRISRCADKVDVIVTDSPLPLSIIYNKDRYLGESFHKVVMNVFNSFENKNYYVLKNKPYNPIGRTQTEEEAGKLSGTIMNFLLSNLIHFKQVNGDLEGYDFIVNDILATLEDKKK